MTSTVLDKRCTIGKVRERLRRLCVYYTPTSCIHQILQCDVLNKSVPTVNQVWSSLAEIDFSNNQLIEIDVAINLAPNVKILRLNNNKISNIPDLFHLSKLSYLDLSNNLISSCTDLHLKLSKILFLDLSYNNIFSLKDFSKLYTVESLNLKFNLLTDIEEIIYIGGLPNLSNLVLLGNEICNIIQYRIRILEAFGDKAKELCLDNVKTSEDELDMVIMVRALQYLKEGKAFTATNIF